MNLRGFVSWLLCCALLVAATWACWRGRPAEMKG